MSEETTPSLARIRLSKRPARERRREPRLPAAGRVVALCPGGSHAATLVDVCSGGARLQGEWEPRPTDPLTLLVPGATGQRHLRARVLRVTPGEPRAGVLAEVALKFVP